MSATTSGPVLLLSDAGQMNNERPQSTKSQTLGNHILYGKGWGRGKRWGRRIKRERRWRKVGRKRGMEGVEACGFGGQPSSSAFSFGPMTGSSVPFMSQTCKSEGLNERNNIKRCFTSHIQNLT